jgi:hypothetical protein
MSKVSGVSLQTLYERLGSLASKRITPAGDAGHAFRMDWLCSGPTPNEPRCYAYNQASDRVMPLGLDLFQEEFFDHAPFPEENWTLRICPNHRALFADYSEETD